ncbi:hypothetical protein ICW40_06840 [Actinotalea ferrariae]|nr:MULTISPECIES: hypothetical protein [Cellulomonadaceae]MBX9244523.1 hypothetical protein [Actinotalea ferrariae]GGC05519.1 hypothetical protein GCM10010972_18390 [Cellulomonas carbonis]
MDARYTSPSIEPIGSLHGMTLVTYKDATGTDGIVFTSPDGDIALGPVSS